MTLYDLTEFFKWCTIINFSIFAFSCIVFLFNPTIAYKVHSKLFIISEGTVNIAIYSFLGLYKILIIFFNLIPYINLLIIA
jgi:hypothetical protein